MVTWGCARAREATLVTLCLAGCRGGDIGDKTENPAGAGLCGGIRLVWPS